MAEPNSINAPEPSNINGGAPLRSNVHDAAPPPRTVVESQAARTAALDVHDAEVCGGDTPQVVEKRARAVLSLAGRCCCHPLDSCIALASTASMPPSSRCYVNRQRP